MSRSRSLTVFNLTRKFLYEYDTVWKWQKALQSLIHKSRAPASIENALSSECPRFHGDALILCEHPLTYTLGRSAAYSGPPESSGDLTRRNILSTLPVTNLCEKTLWDDLGDRRTDQDALRHRTVAMRKIERGGDITLHAPGQLVIYPIVDLSEAALEAKAQAQSKFKPADLRWYVTALEQTLIETVNHFLLTPEQQQQQQRRVRDGSGNSGDNAFIPPAIGGIRRKINQGVWLQVSGEQGKEPAYSKIGAIGISTNRWVCMHGASLNVTFDEDFIRQSYHDRIVPCGMSDPSHCGVTSLRLAAAAMETHIAGGSKCPTADSCRRPRSPGSSATTAGAANVLLRKFIDEFDYDVSNVTVYTDSDSSEYPHDSCGNGTDYVPGWCLGGGDAVPRLDALLHRCILNVDRKEQ